MRISAVILLFVFLLACSKDRLFFIQDQSTAIDMEFLTDLPASVKAETEVFTVKSSNDLPYITKNGSKVYLHPMDLSFTLQGPSITFPYRLEVTELLSVKDIILNEKSTVANGKLLTTGGQFLVKAFKDDKELFVKSYASFSIETKGISKRPLDKGMSVFLGKGTGDDFIWMQDSACRERFGQGSCNLDVLPGGYVIFPSQIGWINIDKFSSYSDTTFLRFQSEMSLNNIRTFLFFPDLYAVFQVIYKKEFPLPIGQKAKVISFAVKENGEVYTFFEDITIRKDHIVNLNLLPSTMEELNKELEKL